MSTFSQAAAEARNYGSVSRVSSTPSRSSAPNAAAAAASARMNSGNLGRSTPSGVGNQMGGGGRTETSQSGYSRNTVNAAAANASRMAAMREAGITQSAPGRSDFNGANQTFGRGVNLSSGDLLRGGYGAYQQSSGRPSGLAALGGLQAATSRMNPSVSSIVAGDNQARFGNVTTNGEIGSMMGPAGEATFNRAMLAMAPAQPKDQSRVPSVSSPTQTAAAGYRSYDPVAELNRPTAVAPPSYANPARAYPSRPTAPQVASYQNPSRAFPQRDVTPYERPITVADVPQLPGGASTVSKGMNPSMGDFDMTALTREPSPYDPQMPQVAGYQNPARAFPSRTPAPSNSPIRSAFANDLVSRGFTGGMSPETPAPGLSSLPSSPNAAAQRAWNLAAARSGTQPASSQETADNSIYGDAPQDPTTKDRIAFALQNRMQKYAAPFQKAGDFVNKALGGSDYNDLYGRPGMPSQNTRDPMNGNSEKIRMLTKRAREGDYDAQEQLKQWFIWNQWNPGQRPATV